MTRPTLYELLSDLAENVESLLCEPRLASELEACPIAHRNALGAYSSLRVAAALFDAQAEGLIPDQAPRVEAAHATTATPDDPREDEERDGPFLDALTARRHELARDEQVHRGPGLSQRGDAAALLCGCVTDGSAVCTTHARKS